MPIAYLGTTRDDPQQDFTEHVLGHNRANYVKHPNSGRCNSESTITAYNFRTWPLRCRRLSIRNKYQG